MLEVFFHYFHNHYKKRKAFIYLTVKKQWMKKGQSGSSAALFVLLMGIAIILYILFLPPDVRNDLLNEGTTNASTTTISSNRGVLLDVSPGTLLESKTLKFDHNLPSFNLFTTTEDAILKQIQSVYISTSKGAQLSRSIPLVIKETATNVKLSLNVISHSGVLTIRLNGDEVYSGEATDLFTPIPLENLQDENTLAFEVQPVGWMFWKKNFYQFSDIKITGTVEKYSSREATTTFLIANEEKTNLKVAYLIYLADCKVGQTERLSIYLNDRLISSKAPDCGSPDKIMIDPDDLMNGKNELRFYAEKGTYLIDQVVVKTELNEPIYPVYFFEVNESRYNLIQNGTLDAVVTLKFINDRQRKAGVLNINNLKIFVDTTSDRYNKTISDFIVEDENFIKIEPQTNLPVSNLKVELK
jgi:hypothetical protein